MDIEVWSDVVCPWCYIGTTRLHRALERFPGHDDVTVRYRSFELDPSRGASTDQTLVEMLSAKYGVSTDQAQAMNQRVSDIAAGEGLAYRLDIARPGNSFDAHRVSHLADSLGLGAAMTDRLHAAYFTEGAAISDPDTLVRLARDVGVDGDRAQATLASDEFGDAVREDERLAAELGVRGVPFFVFDRRFGVSGAQEVSVLLSALEQAAEPRSAQRATGT